MKKKKCRFRGTFYKVRKLELSGFVLLFLGFRFGDNLGTLDESERKADDHVAATENHQVSEDDVLQKDVGSDEEESAEIGDDDKHDLERGKEFVRMRLQFREEARGNHHQAGDEQNENREEQKVFVPRVEKTVQGHVAEENHVDGAGKCTRQAGEMMVISVSVHGVVLG